MGLKIGEAIYKILSNDENIKAKVDTKIFPLIAAEGTSFPFISYKRSGLETANSKDKFIYKEIIYVDVFIASTSYNESLEIADLVRHTLEKSKGIYAGIDIQEIELINADEDYIEDTFTQILNLNIKINGKRN